jgi:hypothetical protein
MFASLPPKSGTEEDTPHSAAAGSRRGTRSAGKAILLGGLVAGTLDIVIACLINHVPPILVLTFIASGLIGKAAFHGGLAAAALGLALQWSMSLIIAAIYVLVGQKLHIGPRSWIARGLAAGAIIFAVMNFIVLPLSAAPHLPAPTAVQLLENVAAMLLFGLIVAYCAREVA